MDAALRILDTFEILGTCRYITIPTALTLARATI
jgi:hypothetical protein